MSAVDSAPVARDDFSIASDGLQDGPFLRGIASGLNVNAKGRAHSRCGPGAMCQHVGDTGGDTGCRPAFGPRPCRIEIRSPRFQSRWGSPAEDGNPILMSRLSYGSDRRRKFIWVKNINRAFHGVPTGVSFTPCSHDVTGRFAYLQDAGTNRSPLLAVTRIILRDLREQEIETVANPSIWRVSDLRLRFESASS